MTDRLIDYSQNDFIAWNREREKHLQHIEDLRSAFDILEAAFEELEKERDYWRRLAMTDARKND